MLVNSDISIFSISLHVCSILSRLTTLSKPKKQEGGVKMERAMKIRELRTAANLTQRKVAARLNVSPGAVAQQELRISKPNWTIGAGFGFTVRLHSGGPCLWLWKFSKSKELFFTSWYYQKLHLLCKDKLMARLKGPSCNWKDPNKAI